MNSGTITKIVDMFSAVSLPAGYGLDPITADDWHRYALSPFQFGLSLNKVKGRGILYGPIHCRLRRRLFNRQPLAVRSAIFAEKWIHFGFEAMVRQWKNLRDPIQVVGVTDIGAAHTVYHVRARSGGQEFGFVLKNEHCNHHITYLALLSKLGFPTFSAFHADQWEFTDYLGQTTLSSQYCRRSAFSSEYVRLLAYHAALGDRLGRGDRHMENYMIAGTIYPIDTQFLFRDDNVQWTQIYTNAGMYEINAIHPSHLAIFWAYYDMAMAEFTTMKFNALIVDLYGAPGQLWVNTHIFGESECQIIRETYRAGQLCYTNRLPIKYRLQNRVKESSKLLETDPILKMYYWADYGRPSAFFLAETRDGFLDYVSSV